MLAKNAESSLAGLGCWLIRQPRQPINSETEFAKASQGPADEFIVRVANADWESIMEIKNIHDMFFEWEKLFIIILDKHAPIHQHKVRNKYTPHINPELKRKMTQRDFYKRKHRSSKDPQDFCNVANEILKDSEGYSSSSELFESTLKKLPKPNKVFKFRRITPKDVVDHVSKLKTSRSRAIPTRFLKDRINEIAHTLSFLFNQSTDQGIFPSNLKIASVCPIYKGEGTKEDPSNYRPISVLPIIARVSEKVIHNQLYAHVQNVIFSKHQSGFHPNHSTESSALKSTDRWLLNIDQGKYNIVVFIDLRKAFDTMNHKILLNKLEYYGVSDKELNWFKSYLDDRKQFTVVGGIRSKESKVLHGVPQGSCLGPLLFSVYRNDLPHCLKNCASKLYADNTDISASGSNLKYIEKLINEDLDNINKWLIANKLSPNAIKTKYMIFPTCQKLKNCMEVDLKFNGSSITHTDKKDYLGLTLDEGLKWDKHIDKLCKKLSSAIYSIKLAKFLPRDSLLTLYHSLVESRLRYCCAVWGNCGDTLKTKLQKLQDRAVQIVSGNYMGLEPEKILQELNLLNVQQLIDFHSSIMIWKSKNELAPEYISEMFVPIRSTHHHNTCLAKFGFQNTKKNLHYGTRSFSHYGCQLWNSLPKDVQASRKLNDLKEKLKNHFKNPKTKKT